MQTHTETARSDSHRTWHGLEKETVQHRLSTSLQTGLSRREVEERFIQYGSNSLPESTRTSIFTLFLHQFKSPLIYLLLGAAMLAFFLGERGDAIVILVVVLINSLVGAAQEGKAARSIEALRKLSSLKSRVRRDGHEIMIEARELVPGDILVLNAGEAVGADSRLLIVSALKVAEAALTGESVPVTKTSDALSAGTVLADRRNMIYAGTHVTAGRGVAVVTATGLSTEVGRIATLTAGAEETKTPLERKIQQFSRQLIVAAAVLFLLIVGIGVLRGLPYVTIFMVGISQIVSMIPEGLPVAMTVALAVAVQRMSSRKTIVRRLSAVETLGSTDVICTDKTGTLTRNEMTVREIVLPEGRTIQLTGTGYLPEGTFLNDSGTPLPGTDLLSGSPVYSVLRAAVLCNDAELVPASKDSPLWSIIGDPTEAALLTAGRKASLGEADLRSRYPRKAEIPFDASTKLMVTEHEEENGEPILLIKGAPERIIDLCQRGTLSKFEPFHAAEKMAGKSLRVLGFAEIRGTSLQGRTDPELLRGQATFLGFIGQMDPPREEAREAVEKCQNAGIRPIMVTGDHKLTGRSIGEMLGIVRPGDEAVDGQELESLTDDELRDRLNRISVFARVHPAQKLRIVKALQARGSIVAMTGDGVNDAPALAQANVGVAMGISGTDVAKEAARIVITDDNFVTIVHAVEEGRLVYANIKKLILYLFTTGVAEIIVLLTALIAGYPPPLAAVQILWINLVTDGALTVTLIMEPAEGDEMKKPPNRPDDPLITRPMFRRLSILSPAIAVSTLSYFIHGLSTGRPFVEVQTGTFTLLAVCQWFNALNCRSATQSVFSMSLLSNRWLIGGLIVGNLLQASVIFIPAMNRMFHTQPIPLQEALVIGTLASLVLWVEEVRKFLLRRGMRRESEKR